MDVDPRQWLELYRKRHELRDAYRRVFDSPDGQLILAHWIKVGHIMEPTYVIGDSHETAHREGIRRFVLSVLREANISEKKLLQMIEESEDA